MSRLAILPYGFSESARLLRDDLNGLSHNARLLNYSTPSVFRGRADDLMINWGRSRAIEDNVRGRIPNDKLLNNPTAVNTAANKVAAFNSMATAGVNCVERTTDREVAQGWKDEGHVVFARNNLRGHSGDGIVVYANEEPADLGNVNYSSNDVERSPLYTKGLMGRHREFRLHVFKDTVIFVQLKKRRSGWRENENYSNVVRNHGNGWIYASAPATTQPNEAAIRNAIQAVTALGLDFGAVDVMTNGSEAYVLEVNTAPGLSGTTTREKYVNAISAWINNEEIVSVVTAPTDGAPTNEAAPVVSSAPAAPVAPAVPETPAPIVTATGMSLILANAGDEVLTRSNQVAISALRASFKTLDLTTIACFSHVSDYLGGNGPAIVALNSVRRQILSRSYRQSQNATLEMMRTMYHNRNALHAVSASALNILSFWTRVQNRSRFANGLYISSTWNYETIYRDLMNHRIIRDMSRTMPESLARRELAVAILVTGTSGYTHASDVNSSVTWSSTPQGSNFWNTIYTGGIPDDLRLDIPDDYIAPEIPSARVATPDRLPAGRTTASTIDTSGFTDEAFYVITVSDERTIGRWKEGIRAFEIPGFDLAIDISDVSEVGRHIEI